MFMSEGGSINSLLFLMSRGVLPMKGMYIHIPFCHQICHYCDYNKVFFANQPVDEYIESMGQELQLMKEEHISFDQLETIFIGEGHQPHSLNSN